MTNQTVQVKTKKCSTCKEVKDYSAFGKNKSRKDGYQNQCKRCDAEYYQNNKESLAEKSAEYRKNNKESIIEYRREYYKNNKEKVAVYYQNNKESVAETKAEYYQNNKESINKRSVEYRKNNKESLAEKSAEYRKSPAKHSIYSNRLTVDEDSRLSSDGVSLEVRCKYCQEYFIPTNLMVKNRISAINGSGRGENNLYCSDKCKQSCTTFGMTPEQLIKQDMVRAGYIDEEDFQRDGYIQKQFRQYIIDKHGTNCELCGAIGIDVDVHHENPLATSCGTDIMLWDQDNGIVVCKPCHHRRLHTGECSPTSLANRKLQK